MSSGTFPGPHAGAGGLVRLRNAVIALGAAAAIGTGLAPSLYSWAYIFAGDRYGVDVVAHPPGYTGDGGTVRVTVGIDPASPHAQEMVPSVRNIVATFNGLRPTTGNLVLGAGNNVPANYIDFESVALHEVGHALGLAHPNAATESGLFEEEQDYTKATTGSNGRFDLDPGADAVIGSSDDVRGDDVNLHWFRRSDNHPFRISGTVDSISYARDTRDLPAGHRFAANADRTVGSRLGVANTEAVMQQGTYADEAQRTLGHDDVAGLRYAMSGVDGRAGTADDYALVLEYAGLDAGADIVIGFDDNETVFAAAKTRARVGGGSAFIVDSRVYFNDSFNWFFNGAGSTGGGGGPDLVVDSAAVSDRTLTPGQSFTFAATVRNIGDARSPATTLDYRRRPAGGSFTVVDTVSVGGLSPSGASPESVRLTAPRQVGTYEYEACVTAVSEESDTGNNCSVVVSVTVSSGVGGSCTNDLGSVSGTVTRAGSWDGSCDSVHYADGRYARYYSFRLSQIASVTIDLTSSVDTFLALRNGSGTGAGLIEEDDDGGPGMNAQITRALAAGAYTIEATTFVARRTGSFTLMLAVGAAGAPDLVVESPGVSDTTPTAGESFTFSATVRNQGDRASAPASLTYRQRRTGGSWTVVGTDTVTALSPSGSSVESIGLSAPAQGGAYEYGACVSTVPGESDTGNNCSGAVQVVVRGPPDLVVETPTVSDGSLTSGQSFTLSARVLNQGGSESAAATLTFRRRRSGGSWTPVGTASVRALSPSGGSSESIGLTAPPEADTYEYGACVSAVPGEGDTGNNCSDAVQVVVQEPPDLVVETPTVSDGSLTSGQSFTLSARVLNQGGSESAAATLTFRRRRSGGSWTPVGTASVRALSPSGGSSESIGLTAPPEADTYEYGACVSAVPGEGDTGNNCSDAVQVVVQEPPDLVVETPTVSDDSLTSGRSFTLSARVLNQGGSESESATLTYRRRRPGGAWTTEGTDSVGGLPAAGTSDESIRLTAPAQAGAYEYGACVSAVRWESETANNCSDPVQVKVCTVERLGSVTVGRRAAGVWDSGCESTNRPGSYARYYSFVLTRAVEVGISLASSRDTYLFLLAGSGTDGGVVASDGVGGGAVVSRIVRTLAAGTYTIEAATFAEGVTGAFTLRVSERRPFTDDPVVAGQPIRAAHVTELRTRINELRISAGLARYSWTDRTIRPGATPIRAVHWRQLRTALDDVYDADGRRRPRYTDAIRAGVPIEAEHVNELRRAVEGL